MKKILLIFFALLVLVMLSVAVFAADSTQFKTGDADLNGSINIKDATLIQKSVAGLATLEEESEKLADADANGTVNVKDATLIQKFVAGIVTEFPSKEQNTENTTKSTSEALTTVAEQVAVTTTEATSEPASKTETEEKPTIPTQTTTEFVQEPTSPTHTTETPTQPSATKPSVDSDGYFDQIIRP